MAKNTTTAKPAANHSAARTYASSIIEEFASRAQTADNPSGSPLAELQAELEDRIRREGGAHSDFMLESLKSYARDYHNHNLTNDQARANADAAIEKYGVVDTNATSRGNVSTNADDDTVDAVEPSTASSTEAINRNQPIR